MLAELRSTVILFLLLTLVTGIGYPLVVSGVGYQLFPRQALGSRIEQDGRLVGSALIGQAFTSPRYFHGRPSATGPSPYNGASSSGSNQAVTNPALHEAVAARAKALREADPGNDAPIPLDLVTASGSGLDPHISPEAAAWQTARVARARGLDPSRVAALVTAHTQRPTLGILGAPRVNVLELNLALDALEPAGHTD